MSNNGTAQRADSGEKSSERSPGAQPPVAQPSPVIVKSAAADFSRTAGASEPDPVGDAIARCKAVASGGSVFKGANARIYEGLTEAYPMYRLIKDDKLQHQRVIDVLMLKGERERMPSLNKAAYNATVLACHPDNPEEYTNCSDWQNLIVLADIENISPAAFSDWVKDKKIGESKRKVRAAKQAKKPLKTPFHEGELPALAAAFRQCDDPTMRQLVLEALCDVEKKLS